MSSRKNDRLSRVERLVEKIAVEIRELREFQKETTEQIRELRELQKKTDELIRELRESQKKTDEQLREASRQIKELRESQKKADEQLRETGIQFCENDKKFDKVVDSWGMFVEYKLCPFAEEFLRKKGFSEILSAQRVKYGKDVDFGPLIISRKKKFILLISTRTHVRFREVNELLKDMKSFEFFMREDFPGYTLCGAIAGISFSKGAEKYAKRKGLILFKVSGEVMTAEEPKKLREIKIGKGNQK
ncbi:hypothetical protein HRbin19_01657 [bacterium HR19]|nr:hypothetical protein HRbin19_01657 [bacterium HR19]